MSKFKNCNGITIIALIVTVIILMILASISISSLFGGNGIIDNANNAKFGAEVADEKELLIKAVYLAMNDSAYGQLEKAKLDKELEKYSEVDGTQQINEGILVTFKSGRVYLVNSAGDVSTYAI